MLLEYFGLSNMFLFCADEPTEKYALRNPFVADGYLYATDGRIAARVRTDAANTSIPGLKFPNAAAVFSCFDEAGPWYQPRPIPLPLVDEYRVTIRGVSIDARYWNIIVSLPGVMLANEIEPGKPIAFVFDYKGESDGQVAVMPFAERGTDD